MNEPTPGSPLAAALGGVVVAVVTDNQDPEALGRVQVSMPWIDDLHASAWARVLTPMAGAQRGFYALPEVGDEVLVAFELGQPDRPVVLGGLWSAAQPPPLAPTADGNVHRALISPLGHQVLIDDTEAAQKIVVRSADGLNKIEIDCSTPSLTVAVDGAMTLSATGGVTIDSPEGDVAISCMNFSVAAQGAVTLDATEQLSAASQVGISLDAAPGIKLNNTALEVK